MIFTLTHKYIYVNVFEIGYNENKILNLQILLDAFFVFISTFISYFLRCFLISFVPNLIFVIHKINTVNRFDNLQTSFYAKIVVGGSKNLVRKCFQNLSSI